MVNLLKQLGCEFQVKIPPQRETSTMAAYVPAEVALGQVRMAFPPCGDLRVGSRRLRRHNVPLQRVASVVAFGRDRFLNREDL
jgi:hypothetical protein